MFDCPSAEAGELALIAADNFSFAAFKLINALAIRACVIQQPIQYPVASEPEIMRASFIFNV